MPAQSTLRADMNAPRGGDAEQGRRRSAESGPAPTASVIIINHNYARYVGEAIESALAQTWPTEVVVVDDGSTDDSRSVIARYSDRVLVFHQERAGAAAAEERGFAVSSGRLVHFLDADDRLAPGAIAAAAAAWSPGVAKIQFRLRIIDADGRTCGGFMPNDPGGLSEDALRRSFERTGIYAWPPTSGNVFDRAYLERMIPFGPDRFDATDAQLCTAAPLFGRVVPLAAPLGDYRVHDRNSAARGSFDPAAMRRELSILGHALAVLSRKAAELGVAAPGRGLDELTFVERRLALAKLDRARALPGDRAWPLLALAWRRVLETEARPLHRALHTAWLGALVIAPAPLGRRLATLRFAPSARPAGLVGAMRGLGLLR
jgi:hypothetical protein